MPFIQHGVTSLLGSLPNRPLSRFWVVTCYFNAMRYETRFKNYLTFAQSLRDQNVNLLTVELAESDSEAHLNHSLSTKYVCIHAKDVLWAKERLLNIALDHLPPECRQVGWCDCDIIFGKPTWAHECSRMLCRHKVIQPFTKAIFMGPGEMPNTHSLRYTPLESFASLYNRMGRRSLINSPNVLHSHPGYVWAARRDVLERMGRFYDKCILGHGDMVMALAFCHDRETHGPIPLDWDRHWDPKWSDQLKQDVRNWQQSASEVVAGDVACTLGTIYHLYHGTPKRRNCDKRGMALRDFDPDEHIQMNAAGVWTWTDSARAIGLDKAAQQYFRQRREDD